MMHMTFYWGKNVTLLFDSWKTNTWISYSFTLLACLLFAIFYQFLEDCRLRFKLQSSTRTPPASPNLETPLLLAKKDGDGDERGIVKFCGGILFGINSAIGYLLMLAVMSFNGGVFVAIVLGLAIGYLLFRSGGNHIMVVVDNPCACA